MTEERVKIVQESTPGTSATRRYLREDDSEENRNNKHDEGESTDGTRLSFRRDDAVEHRFRRAPYELARDEVIYVHRRRGWRRSLLENIRVVPYGTYMVANIDEEAMMPGAMKLM